jgi:hypothetical protein
MAELAGPLRVMKIAIQTAKIAYPDYERESGTKWPEKHLDPAEAQLFAFADNARPAPWRRDRPQFRKSGSSRVNLRMTADISVLP